MENCTDTFHSWVQVLLVAEVAHKELHLGIVKPLPHIEYIDSIASCQQLFHHVLSQEPRASDHRAPLVLQREGWQGTPVCQLEPIKRLDSRVRSHCNGRSISLFFYLFVTLLEPSRKLYIILGFYHRWQSPLLGSVRREEREQMRTRKTLATLDDPIPAVCSVKRRGGISKRN